MTTTLSHAELRHAIIQARTLEAIEAIEAIDALETSTLGGLEARTAKALETVEAISALEAKTAQAIKTIEAMTADALEAIDATVAEVTPGLTGDRAGAAGQAEETDEPVTAALERTGTTAPDAAGEAASSPGTDVARTHIISIEEPPASVTLTTSATETTIAVPQPRAESLVAVAPVPATDTAPLAPVPPEVGTAEPAALPAAEPPPEAPPGPSADPNYATTRRRTRVSRAILLCILGLQAILSLRLHNTAFEDEALYVYSGHMELEHLLHGAALQGSYTSYFSGAPVLYPVAAGFLNGLGGLTAARMLSLAEMLSITALLYSMSRRLFNERIALVRGPALLGVRVRDLPGQLRHLRRDLPVPPGSRGVDRGPHRGAAVARLSRWRPRWPRSRSGSSTPACCSCPPSPSCPRWRAGRCAAAGSCSTRPRSSSRSRACSTGRCGWAARRTSRPSRAPRRNARRASPR